MRDKTQGAVTLLESPLWRRLTRIAWGTFFFTLPVTSFPYLPEELGGRTLVRPLMIYPLLALLPLAILPRLFRKSLPRTLLPLLAFVVVAVASSVLAFGSGLDVYRGVSLEARFVRNLVTLGLGVAFYLAVVLLPDDWDDLRFALRWLYAGFALALVWGSLQIPYVLVYHPTYFKLANLLQGLVSSRKLFTTRISGMTYEPKWFAEQISFVLMPWLLGAILTGRSLFSWRLKWRFINLPLEALMLAWAAVVLVFTFSRTGLFVLGLLGFLGYWLYRLRFSKPMTLVDQDAQLNLEAQPEPSTQADSGPQAPATTTPDRPARLKRKHSRRWRLLELFAILGLLAAGTFFIGSQNTYFARLWTYWTEGSQDRARSYLEFIAFEQRFVYWITALNIYDEQPVLGVGLGNYAFYFVDSLPDQPYDIQKEVMRQITPGEGRDRLITPKNLYARLISETGLLGTALFTAFVLGVLGCVLYLWLSPSLDQRAFGLSGLLGMIVFAVVVFSFDSFALPNMWVVFGLITAGAHLPDPEPDQ